MRRLLLGVAILVLMVAPTFAANLLVNGDFEQGLEGWSLRDGPGDLPNWTGTQMPPAQVFDAENPLHVYKGYDPNPDDGVVEREYEDIGAVNPPAPSPKAGKSIGWARTGLKGEGNYGHPEACSWISQYALVQPGIYRILASWDVLACAQDAPTTQYQCAGVGMGFGDDITSAWTVDFYGNDNAISQEPPRCRSTVWNDASNNTWIHKEWTMTTTPEKIIKTYTGLTEFRLVFKDSGNANITDFSLAHIAAVDNASFDLVLIQPITVETTIDGARRAADAMPVELTGIVTGQWYSDDGYGNMYPDSFAIETEDRSAGIRIKWSEPLNPGDNVTVNGYTMKVRGERIIDGKVVTVNSTGNPVPEPFCVVGFDTGGGAYGAQPAVVNDATTTPIKWASGANNVGILMKIRGIVTHRDIDPNPGGPFYHDFFYVDDCYTDEILGIQTGLKDGSGYTGIKCRPPVGMFNMPGEMPEEGTYVEVTGVMGIREIPMTNGNAARYFWTISWEPASFETYNGTRANKWNLLSLPGMPKNSDPAYVFAIAPIIPDPDLIDGRLYRWDGAAQGLVGYDMWAPDIFGAVSNVNGYWLKTSAAAPISYDGYAQSGLDWWIAVYNGWNIIGMPFTSSTIWDDWNATDGTAMKSIYEACQYPGSADWLQSIGYWWDAGVQGMVDFGLEDDFPTTNELTPWHGYWLKAKKNIGLIAPAPIVQ